MRQQFKPYTLVAHFDATNPGTSPSSIALTDTTGGMGGCNFVSVEASGEDTAGNFFAVTVSSISSSALQEGAGQPAAAGMVGFTSGATGGTASVEKGIVELLLPDVDRVTHIGISQFLAKNTYFFINYGQVYTGNPLRDQNRPKGN